MDPLASSQSKQQDAPHPLPTHPQPQDPHLAQLDALILLEVIGQEVHDALVKVVTAQVGVTRRGQHLAGGG